MNITLAAVTPETRHVLRNMFTVYFSELSAWDPLLDFNEHGLPVWMAFGLPPPRTHDECADYNWWIRDSCELLLIEADTRPAGFVIINPGPHHLPPNVDFDLLDFFVAHKYRRRGVGAAAARLAFDRHPGRWEVVQLDGNLAAIAFWNRVISDYSHGHYERLDEGARQRFETVQERGQAGA